MAVGGLVSIQTVWPNGTKNIIWHACTFGTAIIDVLLYISLHHSRSLHP